MPMDERYRSRDDLDAYIATYYADELQELAAAELALDLALSLHADGSDARPEATIADMRVKRYLRVLGHDDDET